MLLSPRDRIATKRPLSELRRQKRIGSSRLLTRHMTYRRLSPKAVVRA